jgi:hypothetical protein
MSYINNSKGVYMGGDARLWLVLIFSLIFFNTAAITLHMKNKLPLWLSGILIGFLGIILASIAGSIWVKIDKEMGGTGEGAGFAVAFLGLVIVGNGIIYLIVGVISRIKSLLKRKTYNQ